MQLVAVSGLEKLTKMIASKSQIVVPSEKCNFNIFKGIGLQLRVQILAESKRADPCFGVCPTSAWSPSYDKKIGEIAKFWITPVDGVLLGYY